MFKIFNPTKKITLEEEYKELAYEIKDQKNGSYYVVNIEN